MSKRTITQVGGPSHKWMDHHISKWTIAQVDRHINEWTVTSANGPSHKWVDHHINEWTITSANGPLHKWVDHHMKKWTVTWVAGQSRKQNGPSHYKKWLDHHQSEWTIKQLGNWFIAYTSMMGQCSDTCGTGHTMLTMPMVFSNLKAKVITT